MKVKVTPGKYIVAVSGGVDSVALLDLLVKQPGLELVVAHFDHGIRSDSQKDADFVLGLSKKHGLVFELGSAKLGKNASEKTARDARYKFLETVRQKYGAKAIVTAHHEDDLLETGLINILRGTGPQGLISLSDKPTIKRPLLKYSKKEILRYAKSQRLGWQDDSTNEEDRYLRNYLRIHVINKLTDAQRKTLLENIEKVANSRKKSDEIIATNSQLLMKNNQIDRYLFSSLPVEVANEFIADWFRRKGIKDFDRKTVLGANTYVRTGKPGKTYEVNKHLVIKSTEQFATLVTR